MIEVDGACLDTWLVPQHRIPPRPVPESLRVCPRDSSGSDTIEERAMETGKDSVESTLPYLTFATWYARSRSRSRSRSSQGA